MEEEMRAAFMPYTDPNGFTTTAPQAGYGSSGNLPLYTAHKTWAMWRWGYLREYDMAVVENAISKTEVWPGLFLRAPDGTGFFNQQNSHDNLVGLGTLDIVLRANFCARALYYMRAIRTPLGDAFTRAQTTGLWWRRALDALLGWVRLPYYYNTEYPGTTKTNAGTTNWGAWMGRMPHVIAHLQFCDRNPKVEWPWLGRRLWWAAAVFLAGRSKRGHQEDPWILTWHLVNAYERCGRRSWVCSWASQNFTRRLYSKYPGGLNTVFLISFGEAHPLGEYFLA